MPLYSNNRFQNLSCPVNDIMDNELSGNSSYLLNIDSSDKEINNLREAVESEIKNSMNEFMKADLLFTEAQYVDDESLDSTSKNIKDTVSKKSKTVKSTCAKINATLTTMIKSDKDIYDRYEKVLKQKELVKDFPGIKNFAFPTGNIEVLVKKICSDTKLFKTMEQIISRITDAESVEDINDAINDMNKAITMDFATYQKEFKSVENKQEVWIPSEKDLKNMLTFINGKEVTSRVNDVVNSTLKKYTEIEKETIKTIDELKSAGDKMSTYKANRIYRCLVSTIGHYTEKVTAYCSLQLRQIAAYRKAVIIVGNYAYRKAKKATNLDESAIYILGEESDMMVYDLYDSLND